MSYQVLARKWRPQTFHQLVGQEHVKQALVNALDQQRLHHAYLFTGTRGVGKTTIARIFAKSLNCDEGISATPCGQCTSCQDIEAGRFVDLIEIDAASRTKVEDTREILDNVQYAPTRGRYKVYLIDEVHMLSKHSFNALLKTLEEPPSHVKFLLATTDPQKLPITILSRCLQFNLAALTEPQIQAQLSHVLEQEQLSFETQALNILAKAARGSMRDALSLTDQAIAQTNGDINSAAVQTMLGLMDSEWSHTLLLAIASQDEASLAQTLSTLAARQANYTALLDDVISVCHLVAMTQFIPSACQLDDTHQELVTSLAQNLAPETVQVIYQILLSGKRDLSLAPVAQIGFEMVMLRALAFSPLESASAQPVPSKVTPSQHVAKSEQTASASAKPSLKAMLDAKRAALSEAKSPEVDAPNVIESTVSESQERHTPSQASDTITDETSGVMSQDEQASRDEALLNAQLEDVLARSDAMTEEATPSPQVGSAPNSMPAKAVEHSDTEGAQSFSDVTHQEQPNAPVTHTQPTAMPHEGMQAQPLGSQDALAELDNHEAAASEAIAKLLRKRNVSGSGTLVNQDTSERPSAKKAEPQQGAQSNEMPAATAPKKVHRPFKERHVVVEQHLAPELIEQLQPQANEPEPEAPPKIIPEGFASPMGTTRFAHEVDTWAKHIETMGLSGRIRQFALHSTLNVQGDTAHLVVDETQRHLESTMALSAIENGLCQVLNRTVQVALSYQNALANTPFLIQQGIDEKRYHEAVEIMHNDPNVSALSQRFSATLDDTSIKAH